MSSTDPAASMLRTWGAPDIDLQVQADVAVVIPSILRPTLARAVKSVFAQAFDGRVQILIGIDKPLGSMEMLEATCRMAPSHCVVQALYPGYSTSVRHGGLCDACDGGALRTILSYLANAPLIAYLDDDNWWGRGHLASLARAIAPVDWAFSLRWYVHPETALPICVDEWESVGPGAGVFENSGGWVDPNCLMIKRRACAPVIPWWTVPLPGDQNGMSADRLVFDYLRRHRKSAGTNEASAFYVLDPNDGLHGKRLEVMGDAYDRAAANRPRGVDDGPGAG
jgi:hypothetical protein